MREKFRHFKFNKSSLERIDQANQIIAQYTAGGYSLTLRQLYYQYVSRGIIANKLTEYKRLGELLSKARLAGMVDWSALEDRTRHISGYSGGYEGPGEYIQGIGSDYYIDWHKGQDNYVEVWIEKEALSDVARKPCDRYRVRYFSCRGYSSQSEQYKAGKRFHEASNQGMSCHVLHLGDHDPSGIDMTRDNDDRLSMFSFDNVTVHRIALNMDQIDELKPPPNPAKLTDSRVGDYIRKYGKLSWELDALPPDYIDRLISRELESLLDMDLIRMRQQVEDAQRDELMVIADRYEDVMEWLNNNQ